MSRFACALIAALLLGTQPMPASGLDRDLPIGEFHHTEWTTKEGAPSGIWAIAQTNDGWLWFGGPTGLFRFDGVQFEHVDLQRSNVAQSQAVSALFAASSGELLIGFAHGGVSVRRDDVFHHYRDAREMGTATVHSMAQGADGAFWAATRDRLLRFDGRHWQRIGQEWNFPDGSASNVFLDAGGTLWVAARKQILSLERGGRHFVPRLADPSDVIEFVPSPDGRAWASSDSALQLLPDQLQSAAPRPRCSANSRASFVSMFDRDGGFWTMTDSGIVRIAYPERLSTTTHIKAPANLAKETESIALYGTMTVAEDCEGNVWVSTTGGIHRFRQSNVRRLPTHKDPPTIAGVAAASNGAVWLAARSSSYGVSPGDGLWKFDGKLDRVQADSMPVAQAACQARDGTAWVAGADRMWRQSGARFESDLAYPDQLPSHLVVAMACPLDGGPWVSLNENGLFLRTSAGWQRNGAVATLPQTGPLSLALDDRGQLWLGYVDGALFAVRQGQAAKIASAEDLRVGPVAAVHAGRHVLVGGEYGLALLSGSRVLLLDPSVASAFKGVTGIAESDNGDVWVNSPIGALRIPLRALDDAESTRDPRVAIEVFTTYDGYPGTVSRASNTMIKATDGRVWLSGWEGVGWIDPSRIRRNAVAPRVVVRSLTTDTAKLDPSASLKLAAGTRGLRIEYTGLSFTQPERQQFRYRLSGVDETWVDAGMRREAFYTNLGPGRYRFEVLAANESAVWSPAPAALDFEIAPTFVQTRTFIGLCALGAAALLALLIQARVRQLTARARGRLEERLLERERIARELHDTLLQDTLGLVLKVRAAAARVARSEPARQMLDQALTSADRILTEGRDRIQDLRIQGDASKDLPHALARVGKELAEHASSSCRVTVEGSTRTLQPTVSEEAYRIGREALSNAFRHSNATAVEAPIIYGADEFRLRVRDDGRGIDVSTLEADSTPGHWGLTGMRERAELIRAQLSIWSRESAGTEIELRVPARLAYPERRPGLWRLWRPRR